MAPIAGPESMALVPLTELRLALRSLTRNSGVTAGIAGTFAVAIWANILVWAIGLPLAVDPLPYRDADRIVRIWQAKVTSPDERSNAALGNLLLWRERSQMANSVGGYGNPLLQMLLESSRQGEFEAVRHVRVTEGFFETLGVRPLLGRLFTAEEGPSGPRTLVISHAYWLRRFGGDSAIVGRTIAQADGYSSVIVGVMPPGFDYPVGTEAWSPTYIPKSMIRDQNSRNVLVIARLKPGVTADAFRQELLRLQSAAAQEFPATDLSWTPIVTSIRDELLGNVRPVLVSLQVLVALLALLGFVNMLTLMLVRADSRRSEYAIQLALGSSVAGPWNQVVLECGLVAVVGWVAAVVAAHATVRLVVSWLPAWLPQLDAIAIDGRLIAASLALALAAGITCGLFTAFHVARSGLTEALTRRSPATALHSTSRERWRQAAVMCEVAIAVVIVVAAVVAAAEVRRLQQADPGFTNRHVVVGRIGVTVARLNEIYRTLPARLPKNQQVFYTNRNPPELNHALSGVVFAEDLLGLVHPIPGVTLAAVAGTVPLAEIPFTAFVSRVDSLAGATADSRADVLSAYLVEATEEYFRVLKMPLHSGRFFSELDRMASEPVAIVSQTLARGLWGEQAAVGQRLKQEREELPVKVVGVVGDVALSRPGDPPVPIMYRPLAQSPPSSMRLLITANTTAEQLRPALSEAARRVGAHLFDTRDLSDIVERSMAPAGSAARALAALASMAVVLAFVGLYASFAATLQFRQRELGIRMAIGASPAEVSLLVLKYPLTLTAGGTGLGLVTVFVIARTLAAWVPIPPVSATAIAVTILLVLVAAVLASVKPLIRASRLDPALLIR